MERDCRPDPRRKDQVYDAQNNANVCSDTQPNANANLSASANVSVNVHVNSKPTNTDADVYSEAPSCSRQINKSFRTWQQPLRYVRTYGSRSRQKVDDSSDDSDDELPLSVPIQVKVQVHNNGVDNESGHYNGAEENSSSSEVDNDSSNAQNVGINEPIVDLRYQQFLIDGKRSSVENENEDENENENEDENENENKNDSPNDNDNENKNENKENENGYGYGYEKDKSKLMCRGGRHIHKPEKPKTKSTAMTLYELSCSGLLCDAVIFVEDAFFTVHSPIMCTCSSYFQATFVGGLNLRDPPKMTLSKREVIIPQVSGAIMEELIKYAYIRQASITNDNVYEMLVTADYFGITGMMDRCKDYLITNLTPQNCVEAMIFASFRLMDDLYSRARVYVMRYFPQVMMENEDILRLDLDEFYSIISDDNLNTRDEDIVWRMCLKWIECDLDQRRQHIAYLMSGVRLGLMTAKCFMEEVKDHPLVLQCEEAKPLIVEAFKFMYDLDIVNSTNVPLTTPALAMPRLPHEVIFAIGGWSGGTATGCIETYDTRSDRWIVLPTEPAFTPRAYHGSAVIGFKIYCIGGYDGVDCFSKCHVFDLEKNEWNEIAPMYYRRCYVSVTVLNGCIYAVGGYDGWHRLNSCERYDPATNQWTKITPLLANRSDGGCCTLNDKIYVVGGFNGQECLDTAEVYDPNANKWTKIAVMSQRRSGVSCVAFRGCVYVVGGFNGTARLMCAERYDPQFGIWTPICDMTHPRSNFGLEIIDDMIFAVGGFDGISTISHTECYVPETNEWMEATNMNYVRSALTVNNVGGLPNRMNYMYKERHRLVEERKQRLIANTIRRAVQVTITRQLVMNQSMNQPTGAQQQQQQQHSQHSQHQHHQQHQQNNQQQQQQAQNNHFQAVPPAAAAGHNNNPTNSPMGNQESVASVAAAALTDPSIIANAQQSQDEEVRDIAVSLFQQNHRINFQLQDDMLYNDRYYRR